MAGLSHSLTKKLKKEEVIKMAFRLRRHNVVPESMKGMENWQLFEPVLQDYAESLNVDILVSNPHGQPSPPQVRDGSLFIRFWSAPSADERMRQEGRRIGEAYGIPLRNAQRDAINPSPGVDTINDPDGVPVAQVMGDTLYILFDLPDGPNADILMRLIMGDFAKITRKMTPAERKAFAKEMETRAFDFMIAGMVESRTRKIKGRIERDKSQLEEYEHAYKMRKRDLLDILGRRDELNKRIKESETTLTVFTVEEMGGRLQKLREIAATNGYTLSIGSNEIRIGVGQIDVEYDGRVYKIGDFEILLYDRGGGEGWWIRCINRNGSTITKDRGGDKVSLYHPHVKPSGNCCFGNIEAGVFRMLQDMDFVPLTFLIVEFLKSVNSSGWYGSVTRWPSKKKRE